MIHLTLDEIISDLNDISNKRIGYGQTDVDRWWLKQLWEVMQKWVYIEKENENNGK